MIKEYPVFKAAAVQAAPVYKDRPVYFDSKATLAKAVDIIAEAAQNGAKLIVFPETFLPGHPYWSLNMAKGAEWRRRYNEKNIILDNSAFVTNNKNNANRGNYMG